MKHVSTALGTGALLLALFAMSFTIKNTPASKPTITPAEHATQKARDVFYYFYDNNDSFVDHNTAAEEEYRLEDIYGVLVDENSIGGDQLELGYVMPGKPHTGFPDVFLYGHFGTLTRGANKNARH